ncbi:MAG: hypothetical protein ACK45E_08980 [Ignavibacteria bacterium]
MNGDFLTEYLSQPKKSPQEVVHSLKTDLLSDDVERSKLAAALIRMSLSISERARIHGTKIVTMIDGEVRHLDPDSPLIPDVSVLKPIVDEMYPLRDDRVASSR